METLPVLLLLLFFVFVFITAIYTSSDVMNVENVVFQILLKKARKSIFVKFDRGKVKNF